MKGSANQVEGSKLFVSHPESSRIGIAVLECCYCQAFGGGRMGNQFEYDFQRGQRLSPPVDGDEGKQAMLNCIPFAGSWWIMGDSNGNLFFIGQVLQLLLPQSVSHPIGPTSISGDEELLFVGIERFCRPLPPPSDTLDCKFSRVVVQANVDKSLVMDQIVDPIGDGFAISEGKKVIDIDFPLFALGSPFCPIVLEIPNQFLFLTVHRNDGVALLLKLLALLFDVVKLSISIGMRGALDVLFIGTQRETHIVKQIGQGRLLDLVSFGCQSHDPLL
jgi:hypothetical protein